MFSGQPVLWGDTKSNAFVSENKGEDYRLFSVVIFGFCMDDFVSEGLGWHPSK